MNQSNGNLSLRTVSIGIRFNTLATRVTWLHVLLAAVLVAVGLRVAGLAEKRTVSNDEAISYLAATAHQGEYYTMSHSTPPLATWTQASEWKRLLTVETHFAFQQIGNDLAHHDIHPPLYFWLLHVWVMLFGVHVWAGPSLNVLLDVLTMLVLFGFARYVLHSRRKAALVTFIWAASPAVVTIGFQARQYNLFALCSVVFTWLMLYLIEQRRPPPLRAYLLLAIVTTLGALTHYHFILLVAVCGLLVVTRLYWRNIYRLESIAIAVFTGYLLFVVLHPLFLLSFRRGRSKLDPLNLDELRERLWAVAATLAEFLNGSDLFTYMFVVGLVCLAGLASVQVIGRSIVTRDVLHQIDFRVLFVIAVGVCTAGIIIGLYLLRLSPRHAMKGQYLSGVWPFIAFLPVFVMSCIGKMRFLVTTLLYTFVVCSGTVAALSSSYDGTSLTDPRPMFQNSLQILLDDRYQGFVAQMLWYLPAEASVFIQPQKHMLEQPEPWLSGIEGNALYISSLTGANSLEQRQQLLSLLRHTHAIVPVEEGIWGVGDVFLVQETVGKSADGG